MGIYLETVERVKRLTGGIQDSIIFEAIVSAINELGSELWMYTPPNVVMGTFKKPSDDLYQKDRGIIFHVNDLPYRVLVRPISAYMRVGKLSSGTLYPIEFKPYIPYGNVFDASTAFLSIWRNDKNPYGGTYWTYIPTYGGDASSYIAWNIKSTDTFDAEYGYWDFGVSDFESAEQSLDGNQLLLSFPVLVAYYATKYAFLIIGDVKQYQTFLRECELMLQRTIIARESNHNPRFIPYSQYKTGEGEVII